MNQGNPSLFAWIYLDSVGSDFAHTLKSAMQELRFYNENPPSTMKARPVAKARGRQAMKSSLEPRRRSRFA
jgi:hypothetical protein